jgi:molybdopterin synthase catalytic subunit
MLLEKQTGPVKDNALRVRVLLFGAARDDAGVAEFTLELPFPSTVAAARAELLSRFPGLSRFGSSLLIAVDHEYASPTRILKNDDELAVFPPVSGGAGDPPVNNDFFTLTFDPIDVGSVARRVVDSVCGATVTLDGYVREWTKGRRSLYLEYEGYPPMALKEMERLAQNAHAQFDISHIGIVHRLGRLEIGETSVVISVGAPHRKAAFAACEWAIKELKRTVPIWKKEFYEDGSMWVEGEGAAVIVADPKPGNDATGGA